jgi:glutamate-1-semialdehyde aminotransferase
MNVRATIMDLQPGAALPRFASVESPIEALRPLEPVYALFPDKFRMAGRRFAEFSGDTLYAVRANPAPDIITMAKGLSSGYQPISAISLGKQMADTILSANEELEHGFTYSGRPVAAAVALKNLEVMEKRGLVPRVKQTIDPYLQRRLREVLDPIHWSARCVASACWPPSNSCPTSAHAASSRAMDVGTRCRNHAFADGLVLRAIRDTMVLAPPVQPRAVKLVLLKRKPAGIRTSMESRKRFQSIIAKLPGKTGNCSNKLVFWQHIW